MFRYFPETAFEREPEFQYVKTMFMRLPENAKTNCTRCRGLRPSEELAAYEVPHFRQDFVSHPYSDEMPKPSYVLLCSECNSTVRPVRICNGNVEYRNLNEET